MAQISESSRKDRNEGLERVLRTDIFTLTNIVADWQKQSFVDAHMSEESTHKNLLPQIKRGVKIRLFFFLLACPQCLFLPPQTRFEMSEPLNPSSGVLSCLTADPKLVRDPEKVLLASAMSLS